jgi:hypothetical protein
MKPYPVKKALLILLLALTLLMPGCGDSDSKKAKDLSKNDPRLIGTWQQTAIGKEQVSGIVVKLIFTGHTLTMDAPGCLIIGDYTTEGDKFTYTVTAVKGDRCSNAQKIGTGDSVQYQITESQLLLKPLSGGEESQTAYKRIKDDQHP